MGELDRGGDATHEAAAIVARGLLAIPPGYPGIRE
jgi:hypothetical protein